MSDHRDVRGWVDYLFPVARRSWWTPPRIGIGIVVGVVLVVLVASGQVEAFDRWLS